MADNKKPFIVMRIENFSRRLQTAQEWTNKEKHPDYTNKYFCITKEVSKYLDTTNSCLFDI
jgi:hypothetical protein